MKNILLSLIVVCLVWMSAPVAQAQLFGGGAAAAGQFVEVGVSDRGTFGVPVTNLPGSYHHRSTVPIFGPNVGLFGFVSDPDRDGWGPGPFGTISTGDGSKDFCGDYFTPGSPEETWGISVGSTQHYHNPNLGAIGIPGTVTSYQPGAPSGGTIVWDGAISAGAGAGLQVNQEVVVPDNELFFTVKVCITNHSNQPIDSIYYMRNFDPDNDVMVTGNFSTRNTIVSQNLGGGENSVVTAVGSRVFDGNPANDDSACFVGMISRDCRAKVGWGGFANRQAFLAHTENQAFSSGGPLSWTQGSTQDADRGIFMSFDIGTLQPGESTTFTYAYVLNLGDLQRALSLIQRFSIDVNGMALNKVDTLEFCVTDPNAVINIDACGIDTFLWLDTTENIRFDREDGKRATIVPCARIGSDLYRIVAPDKDCGGGDTVFLTVTVKTCGVGATEAPNCNESISASVNEDDEICFQLSELLSNTNLAPLLPLTIDIENLPGFQEITTFCDIPICVSVCQLGDDPLKVSLSNSLGQCWSLVSHKGRSKKLESNLDTILWCVDPILSLDPNDLENIEWYTETYPFTLLPTANLFCQDDILLTTLTDLNRDGVVDRYDARHYYLPLFQKCGLRAQPDWIEVYDCDESDTSKVIYRTWEIYDAKQEELVTTTDVIAVYKLPELTADNFIAPEKEVVKCFLDTVVEYKVVEGHLCWKQLVGLHTDGTYIYYPKKNIDDAVAAAMSDELLHEAVHSTKLIREIGDNGAYTEYSALDIATFDVSYYEGKDVYVFDGKVLDGEEGTGVELGDEFLSNNGGYINVSFDWFFAPGEHGFWVDICMKTFRLDSSRTVCDTWEDWRCENGVQIILPRTPNFSDSCVVMCLDDDVLSQTKCYTYEASEVKELSSSCPKIVQKEIHVKQLCYSRSIDVGQCGVSPDDSGIMSIDDIGGSKVIKIKQWKSYEDSIAPLWHNDIYIDPASRYRHVTYTWTADAHSCDARVKVPGIRLKDVCSGVKFVKATIGDGSDQHGSGWVNLVPSSDDPNMWIHPEEGRMFKLVCGTYPITYEVADSCHNKKVIVKDRIQVRDQQYPTVVTDDELTLSLGGKTVWVKAEQLGKASFDNCGMRFILARRTDWKTSCGVDLCSDDLSELTTAEALEDFIEERGILATLEDGNDIERYYAEQYEWLYEDGIFCDIDGDGKDADDNYILRGWEHEIKKCWVESCGLVDEHGNPLIDLGSEYSLGGGWADAVPFCCEDACEEVTVEILAVDKDCNYTKGWLTIKLEDKSPVSEACSFDEITLSCGSYDTHYRELIEAAVEAGNSSENAEEEFAALDEALGGLMKGWRGDKNELVDAEGNEMNKMFNYITTECVYHIDTIKTFDTTHDGEVLWVETYDTSIVLEEVEKEAQKGGAFVLCGATCVQDVWVDLNDCGVGEITRRWRVYSGCSSQHGRPIEYTQKILVQPTCKLNKHMFDLPEDANICAFLDYTLDGNTRVRAGELAYKLDDTYCRNLGISFKDEVLNINNTPGLYKIHRTWKVSDWCDGSEFSWDQKIVIYDTCDASRSRTVDVDIVTTNGREISGVDIVMQDMESDEVSKETASGDSYELRLDPTKAYRISASKKDEVLDGVNIVDLYHLNKAVIGENELVGYQLIAADLNEDGRINGLDAIEMKRVLLGRSASFTVDSWTMFDKVTGEHTFYLPEGQSEMGVEIIAVKSGDVDQAELTLSRRAAQALYTQTILSSSDNEEYVWQLQAQDPVLAAQLVLAYDPSQLEALGVIGMDPNDYMIGEGEIIILQTQQAVSQPIQVRFASSGSGEIEQYVGLSSGVALSSDGVKAVKLVGFEDENGADFVLYQNRPNPFSYETEIVFFLPEAADAKLTFFDMTGKVIREINEAFPMGDNSVSVSRASLGGASGVIYYQLETSLGSASKRMIVIQ